MSLIATGGLNTPRDFVQSGWDYQREIGNTWRTYTLEALNNFSYIQPQPISFEVPVDLQVDYGSFTRPLAPTRPDVADIEVTLPAAPALADVDVPALAPTPSEPTFNLTYGKVAAPNAPMPTRPDLPEVDLAPIDIPDAPALPDIADPTLYEIRLPAVPDLTLPEFEGVRPTFELELPRRTFNWQATAYDSDLLDTVKSRLADMTVNGLGLPPEVEQAIFERTRGREDAITLQAQQEAETGLAARGLRQPAGLLQRMLGRIAAESRQRTSGANRDLGIEVARINVDSVKTAIAQAVALEVALIGANTANNELALRGAQAEQQVAIDLFNSAVALHNAQWEGFKADAAVFESRIRALSEEINLYKAQVDAQKVIGDVNESLIRGLAERLRARQVLVDIYRANIEGARAKGEYNTQLLTQRRLRLETFSADVDAWTKQLQGYGIEVDAELSQLRGQEILANVYGRRVEAWRTIGSGYYEQAKLRIDAQIQQLERYRAQLQGALIDSQTQQAAAETKLRGYATDATVMGVQAQVSALEGEHADRQARLRIEAANMRIGTAQRSLELTGNYALKVIDQQIEVLKGKAAVVAQLAASSQSGVNFGASYSGGMSISGSYGTSWTYSGDTDDSNPPRLLVPGF